MNRHAHFGVALAIAVPLFSGCFTYVPAELGTVPLGQEVRVYLTRNADVELPEEASSARGVLRGRFMRQEDGRLTIRIPVVPRSQGYYSPEVGQEVRIPTGEILAIQRRELSLARTTLLVGGAAGAAGAIILLITNDESAPESGPGDPPEVIRIPLFSIPVR